MAKKPKSKSPFEGHWRITWMETWSEDVDAEVDGYFEFQGPKYGSFHFAYVRGDIDFRESRRDGQPYIEFSWDGNERNGPGKWPRLGNARWRSDRRHVLHSPRRRIGVQGKAGVVDRTVSLWDLSKLCEGQRHRKPPDEKVAARIRRTVTAVGLMGAFLERRRMVKGNGGALRASCGKD
jgi:hypothetical protein